MANLPTILVVASAISLIQGKCTIHHSGVGPNTKKVIVDKHNSLRLSLARGNVTGQPRACNMKKLKYLATLAKKAQEIANKCKFQHVLVNDTRWEWVGQNLYMMESTESIDGGSWNTAIQIWFDEHKNYTYPDSAGSKTGHYTQVAWANTEYVGCGYADFELSNTKEKYRKLYICNYGPGGNFEGQPPYKTGSNGSCGCKNLC